MFLLSALVSVQFIEEASAAIDYTQYTGTVDGAGWMLRIPDPWNGMLVMCCRGYSGTTAIPGASLAISGSEVKQILDGGFAVAASNYGAAGLCIFEGMNMTHQLTQYIIYTYNVTGKVFLYGMSMGGSIVLLLAEKYPDVYSGVLDMYGLKDLKDAYAISSVWATLSDAELEAELIKLGIPVPPPGMSVSGLRAFMAQVTNETLRVTGGTPASQPKAYEDRSPTYHANIQIPVITLQGTADTLVLYSQSLKYQEAVANAGRSHLYRLYTVPGAGHGTADIQAEAPERFNELVEWSNELTGSSDWPMFRHDPQHSGYSTSNAPNTNQTLWTYTTAGMVTSSPAVADGKVYVGSMDKKVYCLDAATGALIWNYTTGNWVVSSPAVAAGKVYIGSVDEKVYCLNASTGALIWNYTTGGHVGSSPAVMGDKVYVGSDDDKLYCFDALTGALIWNYTTGGDVMSSPAVADGKVYVGSYDDNVYCLNAATGELVWNYNTGNDVLVSAAVANGRVYIGSSDNNFNCLDAATGAKIWNYTTGGQAYNPAIADGKVYVGSSDYNLYCLDALTGALIWSHTTGGDIIYSVVADGKVYVGSLDDKVYCLNAATGALTWSYATGGDVLSSPAVANGVVYIGSGDRKIYAFSPWAPIPEGLTIGVMLLLSTVAVIVSLRDFRKRPRWESWRLKKS